MASLILYPTLTKDLCTQIIPSLSEPNFFYSDSEEHKLNISRVENTTLYALTDEKVNWNKEKHNFGFRKTINLKNVSTLFGNIVCKDAVIGVALLWTSQSSKQRNSIKLGSFTIKDKKDCSFSCEFLSKPGELRGIVNFNFVLYIEQSGKPLSGEEYFANTKGNIIGELETFDLCLDGNGSQFPIYEVNDPNLPLWSVKFTWEDPLLDSFVSSVSVIINKANEKKYEELQKSRGFFDEVMSSVMLLFLLQIKSDNHYNEIKELEEDLRSTGRRLTKDDVEPFSVAEVAINYIINLDLDLDDPVMMSEKIRAIVAK